MAVRSSLLNAELDPTCVAPILKHVMVQLQHDMVHFERWQDFFAHHVTNQGAAMILIAAQPIMTALRDLTNEFKDCATNDRHWGGNRVLIFD